MTDIFAGKLTPSPDAVESRVGDETVLLHLKSGTYFGLDPVGTRVWAMLKDGLSPAAICEQLTSEFEIDLEAAQADVRHFLGELKANDIVAEA